MALHSANPDIALPHPCLELLTVVALFHLQNLLIDLQLLEVIFHLALQILKLKDRLARARHHQ